MQFSYARRVRRPFWNYIQCSVSHIPFSLGMIRQVGAQSPTCGNLEFPFIIDRKKKLEAGGRAMEALTVDPSLRLKQRQR